MPIALLAVVVASRQSSEISRQSINKATIGFRVWQYKHVLFRLPFRSPQVLLEGINAQEESFISVLRSNGAACCIGACMILEDVSETGRNC